MLSPFRTVARPLRRYLLKRLERLKEALTSLGRRLRESIATVIGTHVGDAVRDAVHSALERKPLADPLEEVPRRYSHNSPYPSYSSYPEYHDEDRYNGEAGDGFWEEERPLSRSESQMPADEADDRPSRWGSFLPAALQAMAWCFQQKQARRSVLTVVCIGTVAGLVTLLAGPLMGGLVATTGAVFTLTSLADTTRDAVGTLSDASAR